MKLVKEIKEGTEKKYEVYINSQRIKTINISRVSKLKNKFKYIFLIDSDGKVIEDVFYYLNHILKGEPINTRETSASALKLLFSYLEIKMIDFSKMNKNDVRMFSDFIIGIDIEGNFESYQFTSIRSIQTHNLYFNAIRKYLKELNISNKYFFEKKKVRKEKGGFGVLAHTKTAITEKYSINKSAPSNKRNIVPKYISVNDFKKIIHQISECKSKYELRDKLIILLMFCRGLRLGEVLGITLEDIKPHPSEKDAGVIILRNRVSDKRYQNAKGCMKVYSRKLYSSSIYKENGVHQQIIIPPALMDYIKEYIDLSRDIFTVSDTVMSNINSYAQADVVEGRMSKNYYIFLNKNGSPLSSSGWGKILKKYFRMVGIHIDEGSKKNNLSHRFRHGYGMYLVLVEKRSIEHVKEELRHSSILSTQAYFNPTEEDILKATKTVQKNLIEIIKRVKNE